MPRYYFDPAQGASVYRNDEGADLRSPELALIQLRQTLLEVGKEAVMDRAPWEIIGTLRDEEHELWRGKLSFVQIETEEARRSEARDMPFGMPAKQL